jgi:hypothetical protein
MDSRRILAFVPAENAHPFGSQPGRMYDLTENSDRPGPRPSLSPMQNSPQKVFVFRNAFDVRPKHAIMEV